jgi:hypothetical protein
MFLGTEVDVLSPELGGQCKALMVLLQVVTTLLKFLMKKKHCLSANDFYTSPQFENILISHYRYVWYGQDQQKKICPWLKKKEGKKKREVITFQRRKDNGLILERLDLIPRIYSKKYTFFCKKEPTL